MTYAYVIMKKYFVEHNALSFQAERFKTRTHTYS